jgi:hypothetical protein
VPAQPLYDMSKAFARVHASLAQNVMVLAGAGSITTTDSNLASIILFGTQLALKYIEYRA